MNRTLRVQFAVIVVLALLAAFVALPIPNKPGLPFRIRPDIDLAGGAQLRYKVLFDPAFAGDRPKATQVATDVLRLRIGSTPLREPKITARGDDEIVLQLPGVDADGLREIKALIVTTGKLELYAVASRELQERFERDRVVPQGYKLLRDGARGPLLVEEPPVIEGRHIVGAEPQREAGPDGARWVTEFELDSEGARRFDEAAERLYRQQPRGRIAVVLDGVIRSAPVVNSPAFQGRGRISSSVREGK
jgi:preprotein translocase subunit SecD